MTYKGTYSHFLFIFILSLVWLVFFTQHALSIANFEDKHLISIGGGISHPGAMTAHGSNPAGIIFNRSLKLSTFISSQNSKMETPKLGSSLLFGNNQTALAFSLTQLKPHLSKRSITTASSNSVFAVLGAAYYVSQLDVSLGFGLTHTLNGERNPFSSVANHTLPRTKGFGLDVGLLFTPMSPFRTGVTAYQVMDELDHLGAGMALDMHDNFTLAIDSSYGLKSKAWTLLPGLAISGEMLKISVAYGLPLQKYGVSWISEKTWVGTLLILFNRNFNLGLSYNTHGKYSAELTVRSF